MWGLVLCLLLSRLNLRPLSFSLDYGDLDICGKVIGGLALPLFRESGGILKLFIEYHIDIMGTFSVIYAVSLFLFFYSLPLHFCSHAQGP